MLADEIHIFRQSCRYFRQSPIAVHHLFERPFSTLLLPKIVRDIGINHIMRFSGTQPYFVTYGIAAVGMHAASHILGEFSSQEVVLQGIGYDVFQSAYDDILTPFLEFGINP